MRGLSADALLHLPVRLNGIDVGRPVDVIMAPALDRALGLDILCGDSAHRFLPLSAARIARDELTLTSLRAGRLMAFMFPTVMLVLNVSTVAAIWIGADRISAGEMQVGALIAFLSYLIQILMSVMMATFVAMLTPRASVSADRIVEVLDSKSSVVPPANPVTVLDERSSLELRGVEPDHLAVAGLTKQESAFAVECQAVRSVFAVAEGGIGVA